MKKFILIIIISLFIFNLNCSNTQRVNTTKTNLNKKKIKNEHKKTIVIKELYPKTIKVNVNKINTNKINANKTKENYILYNTVKIISLKDKGKYYGAYLIVINHGENFILKNLQLTFRSPKKEYKTNKKFYRSFHDKIHNVCVKVNGKGVNKLRKISHSTYNVKTMYNIGSKKIFLIEFKANIYTFTEEPSIEASIGALVFQNKYTPSIPVEAYRKKKLGYN